MEDFNQARRIIASCPWCKSRGVHEHVLTNICYGGRGYHRLICEACGQKTTFTQELFEELSVHFEMGEGV